MNISKLMFVGFGNVGQGLVQILITRESELKKEFDLQFQVVAISDIRLGSIYNPDGLPLQALLSAASHGSFKNLPAVERDWPVETMLEKSGADTLVEVSFTNLQNGQPALSYIRQALKNGVHVVTTNKGPVALEYLSLQNLARENGARLGFEGTVMSGTPSLALGMKTLKAAGIQRIQGILNGTTNFILTKMETGASYVDALAEAQALGYAEADPSGDVEGFDASGKVVILSNLVMGASISMADVDRKGITHLTPDDIQAAQQAGKRWKLIGSIERRDGQIRASVQPIALPFAHPLSNVSGATNAITYSTELLGDVTLIGPGAGRLETGFALLSDLLSINGTIK